MDARVKRSISGARPGILTLCIRANGTASGLGGTSPARLSGRLPAPYLLLRRRLDQLPVWSTKFLTRDVHARRVFFRGRGTVLGIEKCLTLPPRPS